MTELESWLVSAQSTLSFQEHQILMAKNTKEQQMMGDHLTKIQLSFQQKDKGVPVLRGCRGHQSRRNVMLDRHGTLSLTLVQECSTHVVWTHF